MNTSVSAPLPPPTQQVRRTSSMAVISLVAGILGWTLLPFVGSIAAIVTGHMARSEIKRGNGTVEGDGLAVSGLVLGYAMVALAIISIIGVLLLFGGLAAFLALASNWG
ncbi:DUF4190 domain-containing protein [Lysobacter ciconiae]|uniref:DUF4190 domain-containing protein n=2 Tax=Lysobacteraceae TaxID=32033 RepID=A0A7S6UHM7_9GAMM|nr:DUF4190 domain-containing protein [Lysobacter ciconiae]QOW20400.1 DUF4190 domain-containing protein [Lysobacter ciconiae]